MQRHRFKRIGTKIITYDPQKNEKEKCKWQIKSQFHNKPFTSPVAVEIKFFMPIPKSSSSVRKREMVANILQHIKKPDIDNLLKFILDCMNGIVFDDDCQVFAIKSEKVYAEHPCTLINIHTNIHQKE